MDTHNCMCTTLHTHLNTDTIYGNSHFCTLQSASPAGYLRVHHKQLPFFRADTGRQCNAPRRHFKGGTERKHIWGMRLCWKMSAEFLDVFFKIHPNHLTLQKLCWILKPCFFVVATSSYSAPSTLIHGVCSLKTYLDYHKQVSSLYQNDPIPMAVCVWI